MTASQGRRSAAPPSAASITLGGLPVRYAVAAVITLLAMISMTGCTAWKYSGERAQIAQAVVVEAAGKIEGAEITRAEFKMEGFSPVAYLEYRTSSTDQAEIKRLLLAGFGVVVAAADRLDMDCTGSVILTDGDGNIHDARDFGLGRQNIRSEEARALTR